MIPVTLFAQLEAPKTWISSELEKCLPLIRAVGNGRNRGLGRATITLQTSQYQENFHA